MIINVIIQEQRQHLKVLGEGGGMAERHALCNDQFTYPKLLKKMVPITGRASSFIEIVCMYVS